MASTGSSSNKERWYVGWFDSPYYALLYSHRDDREAHDFLERLLNHLTLSPPARILDVGCGWGRHVRYLHQKGYAVTGVDANEKLIARVKASGPDAAALTVHDVSEPFPAHWQPFDLVLNLFTAFGYFMRTETHLRALRHMHAVLKPGGYFVLDFMNVPYVLCHLVEAETITKQGIRFNIRRYYSPPFLIKEIDVADGPQHFHFQERIWAFWPEMLESLLKNAGFSIRHRWGDYGLSAYDELSSPRLIIAGQKG